MNAAAFEAYLKAQGLAPHSVEAYLKDIRFLEALCGKDPESFKLADLDVVFARGLSVARNTRLKNSWNAYARYAQSRLELKLPLADYKGKANRKAKPSLTPQERMDVLYACRDAGNADGLAVSLLLHTGMRSEEARTRRIADIRPSDMLFIHGKGGKERLTPIFLEKNRKGLASAREIIDTLSAGKSPDAYLLSKSARSPHLPWSESRLYGACQRIGSRIDLTPAGLNPHRLRRGWATDLRRRGVDIAVISKLLGHASLDVTLRYLGVDEYDVEAVRQIVDGNKSLSQVQEGLRRSEVSEVRDGRVGEEDQLDSYRDAVVGDAIRKFSR